MVSRLRSLEFRPGHIAFELGNYVCRGRRRRNLAMRWRVHLPIARAQRAKNVSREPRNTRKAATLKAESSYGGPVVSPVLTSMSRLTMTTIRSTTIQNQSGGNFTKDLPAGSGGSLVVPPHFVQANGIVEAFRDKLAAVREHEALPGQQPPHGIRHQDLARSRFRRDA